MILRAKNPRYHLNSGMIRHLKAITGRPGSSYHYSVIANRCEHRCGNPLLLQKICSGATIRAFPYTLAPTGYSLKGN